MGPNINLIYVPPGATREAIAESWTPKEENRFIFDGCRQDGIDRVCDEYQVTAHQFISPVGEVRAFSTVAREFEGTLKTVDWLGLRFISLKSGRELMMRNHHVKTIGLFDEYLKSFAWAIVDWKMRLYLYEAAWGLKETESLEQIKEFVSGIKTDLAEEKVYLNQFCLVWDIPVTLPSSEFPSYIVRNYTWTESMRIE